MKIAYIGQMADVSGENGISKKIAMQTAAWRAAGHATRYFALTRTSTRWRGLDALETELVAPDSGGTRLTRAWRLAKSVRAWRPDVIYFRYAYHNPGLPALFRQIPTVAEVNSDDVREYRLTLDPLRVLYHRFTRSRVLRPVAGFVTVTHELGGRFANWQRPTLVVGNSISLADFPSLPAAPSADPLRLIFLGTPGSPWHGLERVVELAQILPEFQFDVVGLDAAAWQKQVPAGPQPENLTLHGNLSRRDYEPLLSGATAAIGSLALYKNGMDEACPLKVREYLAFGLPVLAAYEDTDVPAGADHFLRLPNDTSALASHREKIAGWLNRWRGHRVPRATIAHLDTADKEQRRLAFITRIATASRT